MGKQFVSEPESSEFAFLLGTLELPQGRGFQQGFLGCDWPVPALVCKSGFAPFLHGFPELLPTGHMDVSRCDPARMFFRSSLQPEVRSESGEEQGRHFMQKCPRSQRADPDPRDAPAPLRVCILCASGFHLKRPWLVTLTTRSSREEIGLHGK